MKRTNKNRKGFTLVEMLLSIAIIVMIGGVIAGLCVSIANSFTTTYNIDDSADYAMLYAKGFENSFFRNSQLTGGTGTEYTWYIKNPTGAGATPLLTCQPKTGSAITVFTPQFIGTDSVKSKWSVFMFFKVEEYPAQDKYKSLCIKYRIYLKDNYSRTDYIYRYDGDFWVPRFAERNDLGNHSGRTVKVLTSSDDASSYPMSEDTFKDVYGFTAGSKALNAIKDDLDPSYYTKIKFVYGS